MLIETGSHPSPDGTIVLSLVSTFNNASVRERYNQSTVSCKCLAIPRNRLCIGSINSISVFRLLVGGSLSLCHTKGLINEPLSLVLEFTEACTHIYKERKTFKKMNKK